MKSTPNRSTSHRVNSHTLNQLPTKSTIIRGIFKFQISLVVRHRYFLSLLNKVQGCSNTQLSVYEFQVYLTNTGCQDISMAQFVQTHGGGKGLLYKGYMYPKIHDGKECAHFGDARGTRASA